MNDGVTPHGAALTLLHMVAWAEGKKIDMSMSAGNGPSRAWILATYAQCLETAQDPARVKFHLDREIEK